jgi:flavorubredoxin
MNSKEIIENVFWVGAQDFKRRLFDSLVPTPDGTSYNAYLIKGSQKTVLIDTVDPTMSEVLLQNLVSLNITKIDFIISNHAEQDHSGSIPFLLRQYPEAKVVTNEKCKDQLTHLLNINPEKIITIKDNETLDLGNFTLRFIFAPWVHWPETMFTYLQEPNILFSCDFLGSHFASTDIFSKDLDEILPQFKLYYAEIMMPYRAQIKSHLQKLDTIKPAIIAPSHGPIHLLSSRPISAYKQWASDNVKNETVLMYVSMHGSTEKMANHLLSELTRQGIKVHLFELSSTDIGKLASALVDAGSLIFGGPTVVNGLHPLLAYAAYLVSMLKPKARLITMFGSYGWAQKMQEQLLNILSSTKAEVIPGVFCKGCPNNESMQALSNLATEISHRHKSFGQESF